MLTASVVVDSYELISEMAVSIDNLSDTILPYRRYNNLKEYFPLIYFS